ncbi:hypothetical protein [Tychonema sp. BBK16]|uniref:hypothetical protein n=1 Tax=Tychonema sp. BBK16 TaxID=2699888 RepID=UPI001F163DAC|nr:hypothetical protein [Tychonema sp. BBK16]MCF6373409.1 hypothetical protein [Tychonema sp. BBK16]
MSEADLQANQHQPHSILRSNIESLRPDFAGDGGSEPIDPHPTDTPAEVRQTPEEDWQTVDFPNAISVDAIPTKPETKNLQSHAQATPTDSSPISDNLKNLLANSEQAKSKGSTPVTLMQALHECNRDLLGRISQLETALQESQKKLQVGETLLEQRNAELQNTQEQLTRLFGKQEVSNQTLQSQEISVESLTRQLATTQTRLAIVERESAATVQRYNEQLHQLVTTENVCRELRSRLHRQQRHTLQFKAALEKSLEMPQKSIANIEKVENTDDRASAQLESLLAAVKAQSVPLPPTFNSSPVQPWSDPSEPHPEVATSEQPIGTESLVSQEFNTLAKASGIQLRENENFSQTESSPRIAEAQQLVAEPETESATAKYRSPELIGAAKILSSVETFGIQEVRSNPAHLTAFGEPQWLTSMISPLRAAKKRRSLAEIELPSFR